MNFDFSDEAKLLRDQARKFLQERCPPKAVRAVLEGQATWDQPLWREIARMGWLGTAVPERFGGAALGYEGLCLLAEEIGRALAPVPFASSVYLATEAILAAGTPAQQERWLTKLAQGEAIGTLALAEGAGNPNPERIAATVRQGRLTGTKWPVPDGALADLAVVAARDDAGVSLYLVELKAGGVTASTLKTVDPAHNQARLDFSGAAAEPLGTPGRGWAVVERVLARAAVLFAFEQVGGAQACLDMGVAYAKERYAFGRPIGSFQAIKHKLADVYIAVELARSNAYFAAWALATEAAELPMAAAAARVAAIDAYHLASKENIQTHGGMGFTWEFDCHLYYRRAKELALAIGSAPWWKDRLIGALETRNAA